MFQAEVNDFDSRFIDGSVEPRGLYRLDIDINSIAFTHHHLFSAEHVLARRIAELFVQYSKRSLKDAVGMLTEKVQLVFFLLLRRSNFVPLLSDT